MQDRLNELNSNKIIRIRVILGEIVKYGFSIFNQFNGKRKHIHVVTYGNYFLRFIYCFEAVKTLLKDFDKNKAYHEYSIALILRASLLDTLTILYLKSYYLELQSTPDSSAPNYNTEFGKLLSDQIKRIFKVDRNDENFKPEVFRELVDKVKSNYNYLFKEDIPIDYNAPEKCLIFGDGGNDITRKKIEERLNSAKNVESNFKHIFNLYDLYSKYDHFGVVGTTLMRLDINEIFQNILNSLYYLVEGISVSLEFMRYDKNIQNDYDNLREQLGYLGGAVRTNYMYLSDTYKKDNQ